MKIKRRDFIKGVAGGTAFAAASHALPALSSEAKPRQPGALGILYDATLCVGCQVCMVACKKANNMPAEQRDQRIWENPADLSDKTLNIIKKYEYGEARKKDSEEGYAFIKRHCMHCVDPACVSVCPVTAMAKDGQTGIVTYDPDACIGCRYCQVACPFNIPKFEWSKAFPKIVKCQLCKHLIDKGEISACCAECPTGASLFGPVDQLLQEARRRRQMKAGSYHDFPVGDIRGKITVEARAGSYQGGIYGEFEGGGTQVLMLSGVPFVKMGLPDLPDTSYTKVAEDIQHTLYKGLALPAILLAGLAYVIKKNEKGGEDDE